MSARVYQPLHWWTERDATGRAWPVFLTSDDLTAGMQDNLGLTFRDGGMREIHVWAGQPIREMLDTALHELMHAALARCDIRGEEAAVSTITPRILPMIKRGGWAPPPLPDGWRGLAAHARWVRFGSLQREP